MRDREHTWFHSHSSVGCRISNTYPEDFLYLSSFFIPCCKHFKSLLSFTGGFLCQPLIPLPLGSIFECSLKLLFKPEYTTTSSVVSATSRHGMHLESRHCTRCQCRVTNRHTLASITIRGRKRPEYTYIPSTTSLGISIVLKLPQYTPTRGGKLF